MLSILIKELIQEGKLLRRFVQIVLRCMHALPEGHELTVNKLQVCFFLKTKQNRIMLYGAQLSEPSGGINEYTR